MNADERIGFDITREAIGYALKNECDRLAKRVAALETENAALRVEVQEYKGRRQERWPGDLPPAPPYPRAHDLGMGQTTQVAQQA